MNGMSSFAHVSDTISQSLSQVFGVTQGHKRAKTPDGRPGTTNPFNTEQSLWLSEAMHDTFHTFGAHVDRRLSDVETRMTSIEHQVQHLPNMQEAINRIGALEQQMRDRPNSISQQQFEEVQGRLQQAERVAQAAQAATQQEQPANIQDTPYENRTHAVIGGLGWDMTQAQLITGAQGVLQAAQVDPQSYFGLCALVNNQDKGSLVELHFHSARALQAAKSCVRSLAQTGSSGRKVWLDAKKTRREMKPARVTKRAFQVLQEVEQARADRVQLSINLAGKYVQHPQGRVGYSWRGEWCWTQWAIDRYSDQERAMMSSFAESE